MDDLRALQFLAGLFSFIISIGIVTNMLIIAATTSSKNLHGSCNILIACCAFSDILHMTGQLPKIIVIFHGSVEMSSFLCCILQIVPNFGLSAGTILVLSIAVDRLIAVQWPFIMMRMSPHTYLSIYFIIILAYAAVQYALVVSYFEDTRVVCSPPEAYHGQGKTLWAATSQSVYLLALVVYFVVWQKIRRQPIGSSVADRRSRGVSRAIFVVVAVVIAGWLLTMCVVAINTVVLQLQGRARSVGNDVAGIFVNSAISANYFVLYGTSTEYRTALDLHMRHLIRRITCHKSSKVTVQLIDSR